LKDIKSDFETNRRDYLIEFFNANYKYNLLEIESKVAYFSIIFCVFMIGLECLKGLLDLSDGIRLIMAAVFVISGVIFSVVFISIFYRHNFTVRPKLLKAEKYAALQKNDDNSAK
jgi:hypothetical protein